MILTARFAAADSRLVALLAMLAALVASPHGARCQPPIVAQQNQLRLLAEPRDLSAESAPEVLPPAESRPGLGLAELEQLALERNPSLARAASVVAAARGRWLQVGLPPNPTTGYEGQQIGSGGKAEQHGIVVTQEVVRGGKLQLNRAVANQEIERAAQELLAQQQRVRTDVRIAFYQVLLAQRQIDVTRELLGVAQQGVATAQLLTRSGETSRVDVLQSQLELENALIVVETARNRHSAAWQSLAAVVGEPGLPPQPLAGDAYAPPCAYDRQEILQRLLNTSPEVGAALANIDRARYALQRAIAEPRPNVNFEGLFNVQDNGIGGRPDAGLRMTLPVPLWDKNQGQIIQAQHELAAARQALAQLELELQARLAPVFERYANARVQVERYRSRILPTARESFELKRKLYQAGEIDYDNLLSVQRTYSQTNLDYLGVLRDLRVAEAELDGLLLTGSLQSR
jgi:cobalt-zinc-cadmium efflux system outer membrane protein